jgi:sirohydrochlorin cobalto/nickelchelatase
MQKSGMLLVGHGSKLPFNKELVESTGKFIADRSPEYIVKCAFMEMSTPSIRQSLNEFRNENIDILIVVPLFLAKGVHILQDIPELLGLPEGVRKGTFLLNGKTIPMVYADPIGSAPLLADIMVQNAKSALELV